MTIRQVFQDFGDFTIRLHPDTPKRITDQLDLDTQLFARIVITPLHIPTHAIAATALPEVARYTGLLREVTTSDDDGAPIELAGVDQSMLLGDEDGKADSFTNSGTVTGYPRWNGPSNNSWIKAVLDRGNGITAGTLPTPAATPTRDLKFAFGDPPRRLLDEQIGIFGTPYHYWRINPDGTLDVGERATLWRTGEVIVMPGGGGIDGGIRGLSPAQLDHQRDGKDATERVRVNPTSATETGSATLSPNPWVNIAGAALVWRRCITSDKPASATAAGNIAATQLGRFDEIRRQVPLGIDVYDLGAYVQPGDAIWVYDPDQGLVDLDNEVTFMGQTVMPVEVRVDDIDWPVQDGMGVYALPWDSDASAHVAVDLTPYVLFEDGPSQVGIGAFARTLVG